MSARQKRGAPSPLRACSVRVAPNAWNEFLMNNCAPPRRGTPHARTHRGESRSATTRSRDVLHKTILASDKMSYQAIQEECYEANLQLPKFGLVDLTFGNVSVIDRGSGVFGIKPSGVDYTKLKPEDIVLVDLEGKQVSGTMRPSSDTPTHRRLFQGFASIRAVVHTHSRNAVSFAQAGKAIPCLGTTHADYFYGEVPVTRPMTPKKSAAPTDGKPATSSSKDSATWIPNTSAPSWCMDTGPSPGDPPVPRQLENALALEIIAEMAIRAPEIHPEAPAISQVLLDKHFLRKHGPGAYYGQ